MLDAWQSLFLTSVPCCWLQVLALVAHSAAVQRDVIAMHAGAPEMALNGRQSSSPAQTWSWLATPDGKPIAPTANGHQEQPIQQPTMVN